MPGSLAAAVGVWPGPCLQPHSFVLCGGCCANAFGLWIGTGVVYTGSANRAVSSKPHRARGKVLGSLAWQGRRGEVAHWHCVAAAVPARQAAVLQCQVPSSVCWRLSRLRTPQACVDCTVIGVGLPADLQTACRCVFVRAGVGVRLSQQQDWLALSGFEREFIGTSTRRLQAGRALLPQRAHVARVQESQQTGSALRLPAAPAACHTCAPLGSRLLGRQGGVFWWRVSRFLFGQACGPHDPLCPHAAGHGVPQCP